MQNKVKVPCISVLKRTQAAAHRKKASNTTTGPHNQARQTMGSLWSRDAKRRQVPAIPVLSMTYHTKWQTNNPVYHITDSVAGK